MLRIVASLLPLAAFLPPMARPLSPGIVSVRQTARVPIAPVMADKPSEGWSDQDESELRRMIAHQTNLARLGSPESILNGDGNVFVLIFNQGQQDEGVYTLQGQATRVAGYVLTFEMYDDATRFADLLQAEGFDLATPLQWNFDQISSFCQAGAFEVSLVPTGTVITPPSKNEYDHAAFDEMNNKVHQQRADGLDPVHEFGTLQPERAMLEHIFFDL